MHLASIDSLKSPHITPVWYLWENGKFYVVTLQNSAKARNIAERGTVGFCVDTYPPAGAEAGVRGKGEARLIADPQITRKWNEKIIARYLGSINKPDAQLLLKMPNVCTIEITPTTISSWDASKKPD